MIYKINPIFQRKREQQEQIVYIYILELVFENLLQNKFAKFSQFGQMEIMTGKHTIKW